MGVDAGRERETGKSEREKERNNPGNASRLHARLPNPPLLQQIPVRILSHPFSFCFQSVARSVTRLSRNDVRGGEGEREEKRRTAGQKERERENEAATREQDACVSQ